MKKITSLYIPILFVLTAFFSISVLYSQDKEKATNKLFGKEKNQANVNPKNGYIRCATTEYEEYLQEKNPKRMTNVQFEQWIGPIIKQRANMRTGSQSGGIITIPVVVHVIHSGQAVGTAPNITDAQVESQIAVMNQDYSKMIGTPGYNTNPVGADTKIQFALAQQDPNGNPTNGIDRVAFCETAWLDTDIDITVKPATIWDPTQYMNMWSVNFADNTLLGYAQFPDASGLNGLDASGGDANTDGVVANYSTFGSSDYGTFLLNAPFDKGRTMTHEVGHWLGLKHIWGDGTNCNTNTDYCADTPVAKNENYGCVAGTNTCPASPGLDMIENYMDYTNDLCMNIFTLNQKDRIDVIINNATRRSSLKTSTKNSPLTLFANDAEVKVETSCTLEICGTAQTVQKVTIYNRGTSNLTSATLSYTVNGGSANTYNWTGNLTTHKFATFDMPVNSASSGTIIVSIASANGGTDQRTTNNSATGTFIIPVATANYTFNNVVFSLQQDEYGSETTWNLKNGAGTTLYSGGPYADSNSLPALLTENWTLPSNQCYTFTINDTAGDGICCSYGDGYYDIKSTNGLTTVASGATFTASENKIFSINLSLGNSEFETSTDIYLYPNPTNEILNIKIPSEFGLPDGYTIYNYLGQLISKKEVSKQNDLTVNTTTLSNGAYFITLEKGADKKTLQFIKK